MDTLGLREERQERVVGICDSRSETEVGMSDTDGLLTKHCWC